MYPQLKSLTSELPSSLSTDWWDDFGGLRSGLAENPNEAEAKEENVSFTNPLFG